VPGATLGDGVPHGGCTGAQPLAVPHILEQLSAAGLGWHIDTGIHCIRLILGGVFDRFPRLQIIVGHQFEALSWMAWRTDYSFQKGASGGLKRTIKGIPTGKLLRRHPGRRLRQPRVRGRGPSWSLSYNAYLGMVNLIGIDRVLFTTDYPYANMKAARQFLDQMPINPGDKEKIAHLNAERLLRL
jgi:uncharacterized protein